MHNSLKFGRGNAKLGKETLTFSLPAGHTCPGALQCLAKVDRGTGKLADGANAIFRCFAASQETVYPSVRLARWHNFDLLVAAKTSGAMEKLILESLDAKAVRVRIHVSGDFFSKDYFRAWCKVAAARPGTKFYAYTKSIHFWKACQEFIPDNFVLTASIGGKFDLAADGLKSAQVVYSTQEAETLGLEIDHDDSHAYEGKESFALLVHGNQKAGSAASQAMKEMRLAGVNSGYSR